MDKESQKDYLDWLDDAYKKAYDEGIIDLDDFYKYEEEVYKGRQDLFKDHLGDIDHEISMLEAAGASSAQIISMTAQAMADIEAELAAAREAGMDENGDYIQYLEQEWNNYYGTVSDLQEEAEESAKDHIDELVEYRIDMLKQEIENEKDALNEKLDDLQEFYDEQRQMLQDAYDHEQYLEEQQEKRKSVTDIRSELARLAYDDSAWAQKRKLELQAELSDAEKELSSFEKDHALDMTLDMLDEQQAAQEAQIQAEIDALDAMLNDPHALFNQALNDIKNNTAVLYQEFIAYNRKYGTGNDETIQEMWQSAYIADQEYKNTHNGLSKNGIEIGNYTGYGLTNTQQIRTYESPTDGSRYRMIGDISSLSGAEISGITAGLTGTSGDILTRMLAGSVGGDTLNSITKPTALIQISSGDVIINGNADTQTVSEIRRAQRENLNYVIKEFNKLYHS